MSYGVIATLDELIGLRRQALAVSYRPDAKSLRPGLQRSLIRGRGMDFSEVRHYQAGDEIRHMEWRVTARTGKPHIKIYQEERERAVVLLADFNPSMIFGTQMAFKSVVAARLGALIAWTVITQNDKIGGFFFSATEHSELTPRARHSGVLTLLATLSRYTTQTQTQRTQKPRMLSDALMRVRRVLRPGSILVLLSDLYQMNSECEQHLARLREHNDILAYHICDPMELNPPKAGFYAMTDGEHDVVLDMHSGTVCTAYQQYCQQRIEDLRNQCTRLHIQYVQTTAATDLAWLVQRTFPRKKA
jgi:uncharacterized protein (DUF58 family)